MPIAPIMPAEPGTPGDNTLRVSHTDIICCVLARFYISWEERVTFRERSHHGRSVTHTVITQCEYTLAQQTNMADVHTNLHRKTDKVSCPAPRLEVQYKF
jgi:hypothetical protein